ncbi:cytochrome P450 [Aspergillus lucknowensis]|uniref:Cytochrome P450 n=1 Tax=Aspergillus lucknowensis TaxID=176173 RepID=A0ABR4LDT6_9EURO
MAPSPDRNIKLVRLAHVYYTHKDLDKAAQFMEDFGLQEVDQQKPLLGATDNPTRRTIYYHGTSAEPFVDYAQSGDEDAFGGAAFVVESLDDLEFASRTLPNASPVVDVGKENPEVPGGGFCVTFTDPVDGIPFRLVFEQEMKREGEGEVEAERLPQLRYNYPTDKHRPGNSTQRFRHGPPPVHKLGHFGLCVTDFARTNEFFTTRFNFEASDLVHSKKGKDITVFLHLDRGRELVDHHSFFFFEGPKWHVHHSSFETHDFDTQLLGHHWLRAKGYKNCWGVGRHIMGSQIFDYWFDPSGFIVEHYVDGDLVDETHPFLPIVLVVVLLGSLWVILTKGRREKGLLPGPLTLPILGNLHQIPTKGAYLKFTEWARTYGGIYSLKLGTGTAILLTYRTLVKELIDRKSSKYSNRPTSFVAHTITGGSHLLAMQYSPLWRPMRKAVHQHFMESMVEKSHIRVQNVEAVQMLRDFCLRPDQHMLHPKRFSNSITMSLVYGIRTPSIETLHMSRLYEMMEAWSKVMEPGNTPPVDIYGFLHYIPQRILGNWRSRVQEVSVAMNNLYAEYSDIVLERRKKVGSVGSCLDTLMEGGSDTSSSIILAFIHAMTKWTDVLKKAQAEIDAVVGAQRTPVWEDYDKLPYVVSTVKEAMRWRPAGTTMIVDGWGLHCDGTRFANPDVFDPDHYKGVTSLASEFAGSSDPDTSDHYGYGTGRRIFPGIHVSERNLLLAIAKIIWAFDIEAGSDEEGNRVEPDSSPGTGYSEGFLVCAKDFKCTIRPRSDARRETIMREFSEEQEQIFAGFECP